MYRISISRHCITLAPDGRPHHAPSILSHSPRISENLRGDRWGVAGPEIWAAQQKYPGTGTRAGLYTGSWPGGAVGGSLSTTDGLRYQLGPESRRQAFFHELVLSPLGNACHLRIQAGASMLEPAPFLRFGDLQAGDRDKARERESGGESRARADQSLAPPSLPHDSSVTRCGYCRESHRRGCWRGVTRR